MYHETSLAKHILKYLQKMIIFFVCLLVYLFVYLLIFLKLLTIVRVQSHCQAVPLHIDHVPSSSRSTSTGKVHQSAHFIQLHFIFFTLHSFNPFAKDVFSVLRSKNVH